MYFFQNRFKKKIFCFRWT